MWEELRARLEFTSICELSHTAWRSEKRSTNRRTEKQQLWKLISPIVAKLRLAEDERSWL